MACMKQVVSTYALYNALMNVALDLVIDADMFMKYGKTQEFPYPHAQNWLKVHKVFVHKSLQRHTCMYGVLQHKPHVCCMLLEVSVQKRSNLTSKKQLNHHWITQDHSHLLVATFLGRVPGSFQRTIIGLDRSTACYSTQN